jgi:hypothetical protein
MPILLPAHSTTTLEDFNNELSKAHQLQYWTKISGTGNMAYNSAGASAEGQGRFEFTGTGIWELKCTIPISEPIGLLGRFNHQQATGAATVSIGTAQYNASMVLLANRNTFFTGAAPAAITNVQAYAYLAGATNDTFISGTRFAIIRINVSANTGIYVIDRPYFERMSYAQRALYV